MADHTKIEWADATWNPITGCAVVSPGCTNCYAMNLAGTRLAHHPSRAGLTRDTKAGPVWTGEVRFNEQWLTQPLAWKKPRMIFVCAHGDLFAEGVPDEWIDRIFAVMALAPHHTFQVLTKRARRMRAYLDARQRTDDLRPMMSIIEAARAIRPNDLYNMTSWPLPNVWLGVSAEDQRRANERIPDLLATPAAVRWVSAEPLLGPIDFRNIKSSTRTSSHLGIDAFTGIMVRGEEIVSRGAWAVLDWIVIGGESGAGARPMHPDWARSIRDQCARADIPFFFKQWGNWHPNGEVLANGLYNQLSRGKRPGLWDDKTLSVNIGKTRAGRLLDGRAHNDMPRHAA